MSSHHFVREEQEPALYIHDFSRVSLELIGNLLEWSPYVIVHHSQAALYQKMGFKMDAVVGEGGVFSGGLFQDQIKLISGAETTNLRALNEELTKLNQSHLNVVTSHERMLSLASTFKDTSLEVVFFTEVRRVVLSRKATFSKWLSASSKIEVQTLDGPSEFSTSGFKTNLENSLATNALHLETQGSDMISITSHRSLPFLISEEY